MYAFTSPLPTVGSKKPVSLSSTSSVPFTCSASRPHPTKSSLSKRQRNADNTIITTSSLSEQQDDSQKNSLLTNFVQPLQKTVATLGAIVCATTILTTADVMLHPAQQQTHAASSLIKLPPIDTSDVNRCEPSSSAIGQANAVRDKSLDLRECDLRNKDLSSYDISGALLSNANLQGARLIDAQLSKSYAPNASFRDVDFTNAIVDRVTFDKADLTNAIFSNAVLSDSTFENAILENVDFTDVYVGDFGQRNICRNPTTKGTNPVTGAATRESLGCR